MDEPPSPSPSSSSRPSFSSFWKRTKDAATSATRQVTFVPIVPRIGKTRTKKRTKNQTKNQIDTEDDQNQDGDRSSGGTPVRVGDGGPQEAEGAEGTEGDGERGRGSDDVEGLSGSGMESAGNQQRTAKEKAQIRRAQVRRAQIQHRKRKADYMRQLELDIDMLRDLITTAEQDMRIIHKDNEAIRVRLGVVAVVRKDRSSGSGGGAVGGGGGGGGGGGMDLDSAARITDHGGSQADAVMAEVPQLCITPAPPVQSSSALTPFACVDSVAASFSPLSISSTTASSFPSATATSPGTASSGLDSLDSMDSPTSIFSAIDLDDITVSIVMDKAIGNPVYQISNTHPNTSVLPDHIGSISPEPHGFPVSPVSLLDADPVPSFITDLAAAPVTSSSGADPSQPFSAVTFILPNLTVAQTHQVVNFVLALEHVCWGHAGHQYHDPNSAICAEDGHTMMATSLLLREAPDDIFSTIESSAKDMKAYTTNTEPANAETTSQHLHTHAASYGLSWQAPDITLRTLYGLAVSLNPISEMELAPVQAWFELAARYPLSILMRPEVLDALKRELVGVVRCLYFGAVMEREAFESIVQRVIEPIAQAEEAVEAARSLIGASALPTLPPSSAGPATINPHELTITSQTTQMTGDFASDFASSPESGGTVTIPGIAGVADRNTS